ncbi:MAG: zinc ribbon domain-containing protein [Candidatus Omnitrophica bacterium]|nr:zinc ribbon domain-containing protein [Candidatus Omnitrophota bacterium]
MMPIYVYEVVRSDGKPGRRFEVLQKITDPPLKRDPKTGYPVQRIIQPPNLPGFKYDRAVKQLAKEDKRKLAKKESAEFNTK